MSPIRNPNVNKKRQRYLVNESTSMKSLQCLVIAIGIGSLSAAAWAQTAALQPTQTKIAKVVDFEPTDSQRDDREVPLRIYHDGSKAKQPVVLFSHGLGGSRLNNAYLGKTWSQNGYVAVFMQHHGSDIDVIKDAPLRQKFQVLKSAASYQNSLARVADVSFVIDVLERWNKDPQHPLHGRLDLEHIGLSGHSFGASTTMSMAGRALPLGQAPVDEPRIDAFLAMSPSPGKRLDPKTEFGKLERPIFCMTGTKDGSPIDPNKKPESRQEVYRALPAGNKYHLVLDAAEHHAFGDSKGSRFRPKKRDPAHHKIIQQLSLKFWDAHLKQDVTAKQFLQSDAPKTTEGFKTADIYAWK